MSISKKITKMRYKYHLNAIEMNNVFNQLHIRNDEKAEENAKKHVMVIFNDIIPRMYKSGNKEPK